MGLRRASRGAFRPRLGVGGVAELQVQLQNATQAALREIEALINAELIKTISTDSPPPSRPGQPIRRWSGTTINAIRIRSNVRTGTVTVRVNKNAWYAVAWDQPGGIRGKGSRPWLQSTLRRLQPQILRIIRKHLRRGR
jgi:hypothetical protein